jgi:hypothetical protein
MQSGEPERAGSSKLRDVKKHREKADQAVESATEMAGYALSGRRKAGGVTGEIVETTGGELGQ